MGCVLPWVRLQAGIPPLCTLHHVPWGVSANMEQMFLIVGAKYQRAGAKRHRGEANDHQQPCRLLPGEVNGQQSVTWRKHMMFRPGFCLFWRRSRAADSSAQVPLIMMGETRRKAFNRTTGVVSHHFCRLPAGSPGIGQQAKQGTASFWPFRWWHAQHAMAEGRPG